MVYRFTAIFPLKMLKQILYDSIKCFCLLLLAAPKQTRNHVFAYYATNNAAHLFCVPITHTYGEDMKQRCGAPTWMCGKMHLASVGTWAAEIFAPAQHFTTTYLYVLVYINSTRSIYEVQCITAHDIATLLNQYGYV